MQVGAEEMAQLVRVCWPGHIRHKVFERTVNIYMGFFLWFTLCEVTVALGGGSFYWSSLVEVLAEAGVERL